MNTILDDKRVIDGVYWNDSDGTSYRVGVLGTTKIEAYGEPGLHCNLPWIAVWKDENLVTRVPATQVQIVYA